MKLIRQEDILHKMQLQKLLMAVVDSPVLSQSLYFKGGTCATMLGFLDRFSVDLDFDLVAESDPAILRVELEKTFKSLDLVIENDNKKSLFFVLKYQAPQNKRSTIKLSIFEEIIKANDYKKVKITEIDRLVNCQTIETMFANKLVAVTDRFEKHQKIAGRDIYDIHYFFNQGYKFKNEIIEERTGLKSKEYINKLIKFIDDKVTDKIITEDLNSLLPLEKFNKIRKVLKQEVLMFLGLL
ncbi:MAG: hypothetical protein UX08_C0013G0011 [Candidatus Collierbacteria bacterium GW2011_GWB1_45_35]|uniref:Nucleotidyl transferase AbiEii/AbiGii toxin family protein n=2 Tax=Candidatus Collieribacteriota TaxID=1752725 RepID=A0A0G1KPG7_9BACT|nr:MAG: hypothetical protein UW48_C0008G0011 [Microgenomates group bacterium GW2011_GWC1_44_23]KKT85418.1 MAG: hypothetical protein UW84_C0032G0005 [Candidatus Collierbacteria bacterium GW2011_GWA2_44_99]KKT95344.1 MAG: hypothetical protein UW96_C0008G0011 [Candidatus Collierbacteria bacterium GW2011_GWA1_45_15]KKT99606.1 MAG: hypothetical protein UX01_C0009G0036 [Candidatus Collierbacteria bacterium GW2011_GWB2_45_17]KKU04921.1 MAG: hypothetical protein UX08_C0013G0011 [Candidatus Collierbacte